MEKLELKHLAPYLPYELKCIRTYNMSDGTVLTPKYLIDFSHWFEETPKSNKGNPRLMPILCSLSDLTKDHTDLMTEYSDIESVHNNELAFINAEDKTYFFDLWNNHFEYLFKNHFDVFGLIEKGLAIDINSLKS